MLFIENHVPAALLVRPTALLVRTLLYLQYNHESPRISSGIRFSLTSDAQGKTLRNQRTSKLYFDSLAINAKYVC